MRKPDLCTEADCDGGNRAGASWGYSTFGAQHRRLYEWVMPSTRRQFCWWSGTTRCWGSNLDTVTVDDQGRPEPDLAVGELATLLGFLEFHRATLEWKTRGLTDNQLRRRIASSTMTLGGLLMHMAYVEEHWFVGVIHDRERMSPWAEVDWKATPDWEWDAAHTMTGEAMRAQWNASVDRSRAALNEALDAAAAPQATDAAQPAANTDQLVTLAKRLRPSGEPVSLRWILVHMIEEYARHNGHADLLREAIDGQTGE